MKMHPRRKIISKAALELSELLQKWQQTHDLTDAEYRLIIFEQLNREAQYEVRDEWRGSSPEGEAQSGEDG